MARVIGVLLLALSLSCPAAAQMTGQPEAKQAVALEAIMAMYPDNAAEQIPGMMRGYFTALVTEVSGKPRVEADKIVTDILMPDVRVVVAEYNTALAEITGRYFTSEQLRDICDFFRSPVGRAARDFTTAELRGIATFYSTAGGKRLVEIGDEMQQVRFMSVQDWLRQKGRAVMQKNAAELHRRGVTL